jgi:hypothetical protein
MTTPTIYLTNEHLEAIKVLEGLANNIEDTLSRKDATIHIPDEEALFSLGGSLESLFDALHYKYIKLGIFEKGPNGEEHINSGAESFGTTNNREPTQ